MPPSDSTIYENELRFKDILFGHGQRELEPHHSRPNLHQDGQIPAINCYDFIQIFVPSNNTWINYNDITPVTEWADKGGIVSLMWHFNVPKSETTVLGTDGSGATCTPDETTFRQPTRSSVAWENKYFYHQLDTVSAILLKLQDAGISALWRPFHEGAGNAGAKNYSGSAWFWWGTGGADTYKLYGKPCSPISRPRAYTT